MEQYRAMARAGILTDDDRVELLQGWLVARMPTSPPHVLTNTLIRRALERCLPPDWYVGLHDPITLTDSEPEPGPVKETGYRLYREYGLGDTIPVVLDGAEVGALAVQDLLP